MSSRNLVDIPDEELAILCAARPVDQEAWDEFYDRFFDYVRLKVSRAVRGSREEIDDLIQESFAKIFKILRTYDRSRGLVRAYVGAVVSNVVIDYYRHGREARSRTVPLEADLRVLQIRAARDPEILRQVAATMLDRLGDPVRISIMLDLLQGKDVTAICADRQVTQYQVYSSRRWLHDMVLEISGTWPD